MFRKLTVLILFLVLSMGKTSAQAPIAEVFCGAELNYADVNFTRLYNSLINLAPGAKVHLGKDWDFSAQFFIPVVNEGYDKRLNMMRVNMANISKEIRIDDAKQYFKLTVGLFGKERYGADLRWMWPVTSWLMLNARFGYTNHWVLGADFDQSECEFETSNFTWSGNLGASIWLQPWATELRAIGGRFLNKDYGMEGEIVRHFRHCSVSLFAQYHELAPFTWSKGTHRYTGGFRIVMMIPQFKKQEGRVVFRPATNFRLTYNAQTDGYSVKKYTTDPEENERTYPIQIPWGTGNFEK